MVASNSHQLFFSSEGVLERGLRFFLIRNCKSKVKLQVQLVYVYLLKKLLFIYNSFLIIRAVAYDEHRIMNRDLYM